MGARNGSQQKRADLDGVAIMSHTGRRTIALKQEITARQAPHNDVRCVGFSAGTRILSNYPLGDVFIGSFLRENCF